MAKKSKRKTPAQRKKPIKATRKKDVRIPMIPGARAKNTGDVFVEARETRASAGPDDRRRRENRGAGAGGTGVPAATGRRQAFYQGFPQDVSGFTGLRQNTRRAEVQDANRADIRGINQRLDAFIQQQAQQAQQVAQQVAQLQRQPQPQPQAPQPVVAPAPQVAQGGVGVPGGFNIAPRFENIGNPRIDIRIDGRRVNSNQARVRGGQRRPIPPNQRRRGGRGGRSSSSDSGDDRPPSYPAAADEGGILDAAAGALGLAGRGAAALAGAAGQVVSGVAGLANPAAADADARRRAGRAASVRSRQNNTTTSIKRR